VTLYFPEQLLKCTGNLFLNYVCHLSLSLCTTSFLPLLSGNTF
jgi:hypothetical protein